jgi:hypothetical protein
VISAFDEKQMASGHAHKGGIKITLNYVSPAEFEIQKALMRWHILWQQGILLYLQQNNGSDFATDQIPFISCFEILTSRFCWAEMFHRILNSI